MHIYNFIESAFIVGINQTKMHRDKREELKSQGKQYLWRQNFKCFNWVGADALQGKLEPNDSSGAIDREENKYEDTHGEMYAFLFTWYAQAGDNLFYIELQMFQMQGIQ